MILLHIVVVVVVGIVVIGIVVIVGTPEDIDKKKIYEVFIDESFKWPLILLVLYFFTLLL